MINDVSNIILHRRIYVQDKIARPAAAMVAQFLYTVFRNLIEANAATFKQYLELQLNITSVI